MNDPNQAEIDDEEAGHENQSGVGLNTALPADPEHASGAFAAGPELGDKNAAGELPEKEEKDSTAYVDRQAQTEVSTDPHHHPPILPKSGKEQP